MFINFVILFDSREKETIELQTTTPKEAVCLMILFEASPRVIAWQLREYDPSNFGAAPGSSPIWKKFRKDGFTSVDFNKNI